MVILMCSPLPAFANLASIASSSLSTKVGSVESPSEIMGRANSSKSSTPEPSSSQEANSFIAKSIWSAFEAPE